MQNKETKIDFEDKVGIIVLAALCIFIVWIGCHRIAKDLTAIETAETTEAKTQVTNEDPDTIEDAVTEKINHYLHIRKNVTIVFMAASIAIVLAAILLLIAMKLQKILKWKNTEDGAKEVLRRKLCEAASNRDGYNTLKRLLMHNKFSAKTLRRAAKMSIRYFLWCNFETIVKLGKLDINSTMILNNNVDPKISGSFLHYLLSEHWAGDAKDHMNMIERMFTLGITITTSEGDIQQTPYEMFQKRQEMEESNMANGDIEQILILLESTDDKDTDSN